MAGFRALLDACTLVPIAKADLLLELARRDAFVPLWGGRILGEVSRAIVKVTDTPLERARLRGTADG